METQQQGTRQAVRFNRRASGRRGATATEYIIIVSLIAIALVGVMMGFGQELSGLFAAGRDKLGGDVASTALDGYDEE